MAPDPEVLKRSKYFTLPATEHPHSSRHHFADWEEYHRPLARMHHAHLHDWGIASGLAVSVTPDGANVEIEPGVAIDGIGELIALSFSGQADISLVQPGETGQQIVAPFRLSTAALVGQTRYLTIQFAERVRFGEGAGGKLEQTPWLRLQPTSGEEAYIEDGTTIILAVVTVAADGAITLSARDAGLPFGRRSLTTSAGSLHVRHSGLTDGKVGEQVAGGLEPLTSGGLALRVAAAGDQLLLQRQGGGRFAQLTAQAEQTELQGDLRVLGKLQVEQDVLFQGKLDISDAVTARSLTIAGKAEGFLNLRAAADGQELLVGVDASGGVISTQSNHNLHLRTSGNPQLTLKTDGHVGIGTSDPLRPLEVVTTAEGDATQLLSLRTTADNGKGVLLGIDTVNRMSYWRLNDSGDYGWQVQNAAGAAQLTIDKNGNVGVGVARPTHQFHVVAPDAVGLFESSGSQAYLRLSTKEGLDNRVEVTNRPGGRLSLWVAGGGDAFNIIRNGNVGIGTPTPSHRFHVLAQDAVGLFESSGQQAYLRLSTKEGLNNRVEITNRPGGRLSLWVAEGGDVFNITRNGKVGIGITQPSGVLEVQGDIRAGNSDLYFTKTNHNHTGIGNAAGWAAIENAANYDALMILGRAGTARGRQVRLWDYLQVNGGLDVTGNVGIGIATPNARLHVVSNEPQLRLDSTGHRTLVQFAKNGALQWDFGVGTSASNTDFWFGDFSAYRMVIGKGTGNVTITGNLGTRGISPNPRTIGWDGGIHTWDVEAEGTMWSRNGYQSGNRDVAENFAATTALEPGDVVCLNHEQDRICLSDKRNDIGVVGVVSTAPGVLLNQGPDQVGDNLFPVALCGRIPCKVVAENGPIRRGDLLTTSSTPGRAMKAHPILIDGQSIYRPGTIIGKALSGLEAGEGMIDIFVAAS